MSWEADKVMYRDVSYDAAYQGDTLLWRKPNVTNYFKIEWMSNGTIGFNFTEKNTEYRLNGENWETVGNIVISASTGDIVELRGTENSYDGNGINDGTAEFKAYGNIMSLLYGDDHVDKYALKSDRCFYGFFYNCPDLKDASNLLLPSTSLTRYCYAHMFEGTGLQDDYMPSLPATQLNEFCYSNMFSFCDSLLGTKKLPATTLSTGCYSQMFFSCVNLVSAPVLPALTLVNGCYGSMFEQCLRLDWVKCLATDISANNSTSNWLYGVSQTGTFYKDANTTWPSGSSGIPNGWTVIDA